MDYIYSKMANKNQPHDRYFKDMFQHCDLAKEFLDIYLDRDIHKEVDWATFTPYDTSFIGGKERQKYADILYSAQIKDQAIEVLFMLNHERNPDKMLGLKIAEYIIGATRRSLRQGHDRHVFVLSFTLYNGVQRPYPYPYPYSYSHLSNLTGMGLIDKLRLSEQSLIDLSRCEDAVLYAHGNVGLVELFMKQVNNDDIVKWLGHDKNFVLNLERSQYVDRSLRYLVDVNAYEMRILLSLLEEISPKLKEKMLTTSQQIERKGIQQGMQQGIQQGKQLGFSKGVKQIAKQMLLHLHMDIDLTQKATGLSREELEALQKEGM